MRETGIRPTLQRMAIAERLLAGPSRHVTAEQVWDEVKQAGADLSLATVYNTLNQFQDAGLLGQVCTPSGRTYFDTNPAHHHHAVDPDTGELHDIAADAVTVTIDPRALPRGTEVDQVGVVIHLRR